ncbi:hypothetical protein OS187_13215 [Xanthomonadaceae bacterium JHOS43]|nr:hypothetical protein [Xanthomonadaceae bacterium JHOS43]
MCRITLQFAFLMLACSSAYGQTPNFFELEPNSTCATGTPFSVGSGLGGGQLANVDDVDYFRFSSTSTSALTLTLAPENSNYDGGVIYAAIYDQSNSLLARRRVNSDSPALPLRAIVGSGTYCLKFDRVPSYQIFTKEYRLLAVTDASDPAIAGVELEPNNLIAQADELLLDGSPIWSQLSSDVDYDYFRINASSAQDIDVSIDVETRGYDGTTLKAWLVDSSGAPLAGRRINSDQASARSLLARRPNGGPVYVKLEKNENYSLMDRYVSISATTSSIFGLRETEPNNFAGSNRVVGPGILVGQLSSIDDIDVFDINLMAGVAQFEVRPENTLYDGGVIIFEVRNSSESVLTSREVGSDSVSQTVNVGIATPGVYRIIMKRKVGYQFFDKYYWVTIPAGPEIFQSGFEI